MRVRRNERWLRCVRRSGQPMIIDSLVAIAIGELVTERLLRAMHFAPCIPRLTVGFASHTAGMLHRTGWTLRRGC